MTYAKHPEEASLALFATGDLAFWERVKTGLHVNRCADCRAVVAEYREDRSELAGSREDLPEGIDWDRLSAEMTANIHLGLEAGECVTPREGTAHAAGNSRDAGNWWTPVWRPAAVAAGAVLLLGSAWWVNFPQGDADRLARVATAVFGSSTPIEETGPILEASDGNIELHENGASWGMRQDGAEQVTTEVSLSESVSGTYVDDDTFQVTIATVHVQ